MEQLTQDELKIIQELIQRTQLQGKEAIPVALIIQKVASLITSPAASEVSLEGEVKE